MRTLCLLALLLVSAVAAAQSVGETVVLAAAGAGGGLALTAVSIVVPPPVTFPVGVALGMVGAARLMGIDASLRNTLGDAAVGMLAGGAAGGATYLLLSTTPLGTQDALGNVLIGAGVAAAGTVAWAVRGVRVEPAVLRAPAGEQAGGLTLHVAF